MPACKDYRLQSFEDSRTTKRTQKPKYKCERASSGHWDD